MPYVGNVPAEQYASFEVQHFTTSATTSYTLTHAVANELDIRLVLNNVIQQPGASYAYTASATTLTLSSATAGTDTMYAVYIGKAVQTVTPPDGSVSESKLQVSNSPTNGYVLSAQSGVAGGLTWAADAAGTITAFTNGVDDRVVTATSATALNGEANLTFAANVLAMIVPIDTASILRMSGNRVLAGESLGSVEYQWNGTPVCKITGTSGSDTTNKDDGNLSFYTRKSGESITERMRINKDGIVGIGAYLDGDLGVGLHIKTSDTGADVHSSADELVIERNGDGGMTFLNSTSGESFINFGDSGDNDAGKISYHHSYNKMYFFTNGAEKLTIDSDGSFYSTMSDTNGHQMWGTWTSGTNTLFNWIDGSGNTCGTIGMDAGNNTSSYNTSSDYRLKNNVEDLTGAIDRVKELKPKRFNWISNPSGDKFDGFIAHEVSSVIPEAIHGEKDAMYPEVLYKDKVLYTAEDELPEGISIGDTKIEADVLPEGKNFGDVKEAEKINPQGIDQSKLVPLLTKALQEAITKIETLERSGTNLL